MTSSNTYIFSGNNTPNHYTRLLEKHSSYEVIQDMLQLQEDEDEITDDGPMKTRRGRKTGQGRVTLEVFDELLHRVIGNWYQPRTGFETDPFYEIMIVCIMFLR